ncbi:tautomerase family protein [Lonepinella sp. BR2930]|uniref:tautomerase family protein n=1 Tax=unclassified Lonepinella TaxID=2642006 RepID=UPI003F6E33AF
MPLIQITLVEGRDDKVVTECAKEIAQVAHTKLGAPLESIRVVVNQVPATHWIVGNQSKAERDAVKGESK